MVTFQKDYQNLAVHRTTGIHLTLQEEVEPSGRIQLQRLQPEPKDEVASVHVDVDVRMVLKETMKEVHLVKSTAVAVVMVVHLEMHDDVKLPLQLTVAVEVKMIPKMNQSQLQQRQQQQPPSKYLHLQHRQVMDFEMIVKSYYCWLEVARQQLNLKWQDSHGYRVHHEDDSLMRPRLPLPLLLLNGDGAIDVHDDWKKQKEIH